MDNIDWLLIKKIGEKSSLSQISQTLFISQPALSKRLIRMEKSFGNKIVYRNNKGISLTDFGQYLYEQSKRIIQITDEIENRLSDFQSLQKNAIRIGMPSTFAKYSFLDVSSSFNNLYPNSKFQIKVAVSSNIPNLMENNSIDCGFTLGDYNHNYNQVLFDTQKCYAIYSKPFTLDDLPNIPMVVHNQNQETQKILLDWWKKHYRKPFEIGVQVTNLDTALDIVSSGMGFSLAFGSFLKKRNDFNIIPLFNPNNTPLIRNTWFLYKEEYANNSVNNFIDYIKLSSQNNVNSRG